MEDGKVVDKALFPRDAKAIAKKLSGECPEEAELRSKHPKARKGTGRLDLPSLAEKLGFCTRGELPEIISKVNEELAKIGVSEGFGRDRLVVNAVRAQRALEDSVNTQCETLREWYSIHFPELNDLLKDNKDYLTVVAQIGGRNNMVESELAKILDDRRYVRAIPPIAQESVGSEVSTRDLMVIQNYAEAILSSAQEEADLRAYINKTMKEIAPNLSEVATPYVGALLIEQAGSLEKLARLPASTVQVLGAQKAMFRFLKTGKKPPKHGVLYLHPLVSQAPKNNKGRIARMLAGKISIAAKVDFYGGRPIGGKLKEESEERVESLRE